MNPQCHEHYKQEVNKPKCQEHYNKTWPSREGLCVACRYLLLFDCHFITCGSRDPPFVVGIPFDLSALCTFEKHPTISKGSTIIHSLVNDLMGHLVVLVYGRSTDQPILSNKPSSLCYPPDYIK